MHAPGLSLFSVQSSTVIEMLLQLLLKARVTKGICCTTCMHGTDPKSEKDPVIDE